MEAMKIEFERLGYQVDHRDYSPHDFGIPQHRQRIFIRFFRVNSSNPLVFDNVDKNKNKLL